MVFVVDEFDRVDTLDLPYYARPTGIFEQCLAGLEACKIFVNYYGDDRGRPLPVAERKRRHVPLASHFSIRNDIAVFRSNGTTGISPIFFSGVMGNRGGAWLLPDDYRPERELRETGEGVLEKDR